MTKRGGAESRILELDWLKSMMSAAGATRLYAKPLSPNDNSKNQVYFGGNFEALNLFPSADPRADRAGTKPIFKAALDFAWLNDRGQRDAAPGAQLILYPQYPEVRFSGFLQGAAHPPSEVMASREPGRVLFLGVTADKRILGFAAPGGSALALSFEREINESAGGVFRQLALEGGEDPAASRIHLMAELQRIHELGWIRSWRLKKNKVRTSCESSQCIGYTLEAELGIVTNPKSTPDFEGWEVKGHSVDSFDRPESGVITLMTPEPTGGFYKEQGIEAFIRKYGYPDVSGRPNRLNVGGIHRVGERGTRTGLTMEIRGFNKVTGKIVDSSGGICLVSDDGKDAAVWSFELLIGKWNLKHAKAVYVPGIKREELPLSYRYDRNVRLGEGTDFLKFIKAVAAGTIYYDPGIKLENIDSRPTTKRRSQIRTKSKDLACLYDSFTTVDIYS